MANKKRSDQEKHFYIEQIKTTKRIIDEFSNNKDFSPTMLLNSLLSLVVLPFEKAKTNNGDKIFKGKFNELMRRFGIHPVIFLPIKLCEDKLKCGNRTIYAFVNKLRNGIAHQNLKVSVDENRNVWITIYNKYSGRNCRKCTHKSCTDKGLTYSSFGIIDFEIKVSVTQLQKIAIYIADSYLKSIEE